MHGYSDRVNHAFAFTAKHYLRRAPAAAGMGYLAHPSNTAVILARYGVDETTLVAGILHHVLEEAARDAERAALERKIGQKFGPVVLAVAREAMAPQPDEAGGWMAARHALAAHVLSAEPRALDILVADEIHLCGQSISTARRLGPEYVLHAGRLAASEMMQGHRRVLEALEGRDDWPRRPMLDEYRALTTELLRALRAPEADA